MANKNHASRAHALLSASGASRWLKCTPSARLEEKFTESASSVYADEGTLAHEFADVNLHLLNGQLSKANASKELTRLRKHKLYSLGMEYEVEDYTSYVMGQLQIAKQTTPSAFLAIEQRFDFSHIVEQGFGTGDAAIVTDHVLEIIDLKYGKGVSVDADENPQLMLYSIGALRSFEMSYDIKAVKMTIVQPRLNHISSYQISVEELLTWGENVVKPKAALAYQGKGEKVAGDHCKWCKVKAMCPELAAKNLELAKFEFADPEILTDSQILDIYAQQPMLVDWVKAVSDYILNTAIKGKKWPGHKVVSGKSNRKWKDETTVISILREQGIHEDTYIKKSLEGIPTLEKILGKEVFPKLLGSQVLKPDGAPTLVSEKDPRPALGVESARLDFS